MDSPIRGSRKHVLDLVTSGLAAHTFNELLADVNCRVRPSHRIRPISYSDPGESDLRGFCTECGPAGVDLQAMNDWWVSAEYKGPTWDLLAECTIAERAGYLLVEAKAHESELQRGGKSQRAGASEQSQANHGRIAECLERTQTWFRSNVDPQCQIGIDSHYQLANRLSAAEALASCGVPVILLYLGFTGDTYFKSDFFKDDPHWQRVMGAYLDGVVPLGWPGQTTPRNDRGGSVTMLIRSLPVRSISR